MKKASGSILVALLWCLTLLAVLVVGLLYTARTDLTMVKNYGDQIQAHYLALAGLEKAKALLYHEAAERKQSAQNHTGALYNSPENFRDVKFGRGQFRVVRQDSRDEGGQLLYGISDEESRLNVNHCSPEELMKLFGMTPEIAAAINDWRDGDSSASPGGAEREYYSSLRPPYVPRDDRIQTARELLLVRGITAELLMGEDTNLNGLLDPEENDGDLSLPSDNSDSILDGGWAGVFSFESKVRNQNAAGQERIDVQTADESQLRTIPGITTEIAKAIVSYRGQNRMENIADLLDVAAMTPQPGQSGQPAPGGRQSGGSREGGGQPTGPKLISEELFLEIADDVCTSPETARRGLVNINTASAVVLACLPGISEELARAIISYRESAGFFPNIGWLLKVPGMNRELFKQVAPKVCPRSETFRIVSEGKVGSSGARKRLEMIVQLGASRIDTISYRENL
jgi:competence ComEA-like helix-hairpin-helix protein